MAVPYHTHSFEIPSATKAEVEAGVRTDVAATPASLGSAASKDVSYFATASQGNNADTAVQPTLVLTAGDGLTGGGTLAANRIFALSSTSLASLALADTAVQTINGKSGRTITLSSDDVSAIPIAREAEIIANTAARHTHSNKSVLDATTAAFTTAMSAKLAGIPADADKTPGIATVTSDGLMSSGDKAKLNGMAAGATANTGTVTSVAVTVPAGLAVAGAPITTAGTFAISYAAGYLGYTTAEANKLAGIPADADKTPALAAVATSGNYADLNGKPTLGILAAKNKIAVADISATGTPSSETFLRGDGTWGTVAGAGTVTSVGLSAPTGFSVSGSPVTGSGTLTIAYASGYQGYTTAEANKLAGIPADADKTPALAAVATTGSYGDLSGKPATFPPSAHTHTPSEVGLGNVANKSESQMVASGAIADALSEKSFLAGFRNKIINGDFNVWQRGEGPHTGFNYTADRWGCYKNSGTELASVSRQLFVLGDVDVPGSPAGYLRANVTNGGNAASGYISIAQQIEGVRTLAGVKATLTFYARVNTPREVAIELSHVFGSGGSPRLNILVGKAQLATTWKKFSYVIDIPSLAGKTVGSNDNVGIGFVLSAGTDFAARTGNIGIQTGAFDFARVSLVEGDATAEVDPFSPRHIQQELAMCQRYFQRVSEIVMQAAFQAGHANRTTMLLPVPMRVSPTITYTSSIGSGVAILSSSIADRLVLAAFPGADGLISVGGVKLEAEL